MSKGITTVVLRNNVSGKEETLDIPCVLCRDSIAIDSEFFFSEEKDGKIGIRRGRISPKNNWISFKRDIFNKSHKVPNGPIVYIYEETLMIDRCSANTLKGKRCGNEALLDNTLCKTHHNKKSVNYHP